MSKVSVPSEEERATLDLSNPRVLKALLAQHGMQPKHRLGQNFLIDSHVLDLVVQVVGADPEALLLEIGPGLGGLTQRLAATGARVLALELDQKLVEILHQTLQPAFPRLEVVQADAGAVDLRALLLQRLAPGQKARVAANLPYYITTPLLMRLLEEDLPLEQIVVMVQKEVADRMVSPPGSKEYGALSVAVQYYTAPRIVASVSMAAFVPPPSVDSAVVEMRVRSSPAVDASRSAFFRVVRAAFGQRRKTVGNALAAGLSREKQQVQHALEAVGIDPARRGETLSLPEFALVAQALFPAESGQT